MPKVSIFARANVVHSPKVVDVDAVLDDIQHGKYEQQITELRKLEGAAFQEKKKLLKGFTVSGVFSERNDSGLEGLSGLIQLDLDAKDNKGKKYSELREIVINCPHVYAAFRSPSGKGIKALVRCKPDKDLHTGSHAAVVEYFRDRGVNVDERACALSQLCFISSDPHLYRNPSAKVIPPVEVEKSVESTLVEYEEDRTDEEILAACEDAWGETFTGLWAGEVGGDPSTNDHQLIAILRENCHSNERVVDLFQQSGLYRPEKWAGNTYGYVMKSLSRCSAVKALSLLSVVPEDPDDPSPPRKKQKGAWGWTTAAEIGEWKAEEDNYIIKRILYAGTTSCIFGAPGSSKTFCIFSMAAAIACGTEWKGHKVRQGAVMYFGLEGHHGIRKRIQAMKKGGHLTEEGSKYFAQIECKEDSLNLLDESHVKKIRQTVEAYQVECGDVPVVLIIIDTLARATPGGDENSTKDMGVAVINSQAVASQTGCGVIIVHHSGKNAALGMRGSTALPAAFDSVYEVSRHEADDTVRVFSIKKQRDESDAANMYFKLQQVKLGVDADLEEVTSCLVRFLEDSEIPVKQEKGKAGLDSIMEHVTEEGVSYGDLIKASGLPRSTVQRRVNALVDSGDLRKADGKVYKVFQEILDDKEDDPTANL